MGFKLFILSLAVLAVAVSASSICKCGTDLEEKKDSVRPASKSVEYTSKMNKDGKDYEEKVEIDTEKETETFHVPKTSDKDEAGDIVYDFKQNLTMIRIPVSNSCFLSDSTYDAPKPADLKKLLESKDGVMVPKPQTEAKLKVVGTLEDRSHLIDEMLDLCANLPIYVMGELDSTDVAQPTAKRTKRDVLD
ncbi:hypothetical protein OS493_027291 [Desmophyllum pertusum]|uniref:BRICHOS domain-containing protein n=1 Tax=Desmophyllum pertusum TaxID=174260 RepID=A0A9W9YXH9_9CNID|nr:hypothetical protein OS493_027291 [Desmophyllum pertusum]